MFFISLGFWALMGQVGLPWFWRHFIQFVQGLIQLSSCLFSITAPNYPSQLVLSKSHLANLRATQNIQKVREFAAIEVNLTLL